MIDVIDELLVFDVLQLNDDVDEFEWIEDEVNIIK